MRGCMREQGPALHLAKRGVRHSRQDQLPEAGSVVVIVCTRCAVVQPV
jgi:hypothetical protein